MAPLPFPFALVAGLIAGSTVALVFNRLPLAAAPGALGGWGWRRCQVCGASLPVRFLAPGAELIPGRLPPCGHALPAWRGWNLGGLAAAGLGVGWLCTGQPWPETSFALLLLCLLWPLAVIDLLTLEVETRLVAAGVAMRLAGVWFFDRSLLPEMALGMLAGAGLFTMVEATYRAVRNRVGLGEGDAAVLGLIGAFVGWQGVLPVVALSALAGLLGGGGWLVWRKGALTTPIPYVPFLALAGVVVFLLQRVAGGAGWRGVLELLPLLPG